MLRGNFGQDHVNFMCRTFFNVYLCTSRPPPPRNGKPIDTIPYPDPCSMDPLLSIHVVAGQMQFRGKRIQMCQHSQAATDWSA